MFGIASAPAIWQRTIDQILQRLEGVYCTLDDMVITGKDDKEHLNNLSKVLQRLEEFNLRANKLKCYFFEDKIEYCGHIIDKHGLHKTQKKVEVVLITPEPKISNRGTCISWFGKLLSQVFTKCFNSCAPITQIIRKAV